MVHDAQKLVYIRELLKDPKAECLGSFEYPHVGWELDNVYWIMKSKGKILYVTTTHNRPILKTKEEVEQAIEALQKYVDDARTTLNWLKPVKEG